MGRLVGDEHDAFTNLFLLAVGFHHFRKVLGAVVVDDVKRQRRACTAVGKWSFPRMHVHAYVHMVHARVLWVATTRTPHVYACVCMAMAHVRTYISIPT